MQANLSEALVQRNKMLDHLFITKEITIKEKKNSENIDSDTEYEELDGGYISKSTKGVFCSDCDEVVQLVLFERGLDPHDCDVHCGFDGGQGILKIGVTITERNDSCKETK